MFVHFHCAAYVGNDESIGSGYLRMKKEKREVSVSVYDISSYAPLRINKDGEPVGTITMLSMKNQDVIYIDLPPGAVRGMIEATLMRDQD